MAADFESQLEGFRVSDARRDGLLAQLIGQVKELQIQLSDATNDFENEKKSRREWQKQAQDHVSTITEYERSANSNNFVVALIDGDGARVSLYTRGLWSNLANRRAQFQNDLYKSGADGGRRAAGLLHSAIEAQLKVQFPDSSVSDWKIIVLVMCNLQVRTSHFRKSSPLITDRCRVLQTP
jgi:hypothetical protein